MNSYIIEPKKNLQKGILLQTSPLAEEFKAYLDGIGIKIIGFCFDENYGCGNLGLYLIEEQTFDLAYRIMFQGFIGRRDRYENSEESLLKAEKECNERLANITKTLLSLFDKYNISYKYSKNLSIYTLDFKQECLVSLYEKNMKPVLNELCEAGVSPSFFVCAGASYIIGCSEIPIPLPPPYQEKIYNIVSNRLSQNDQTGFFLKLDISYKTVIDYGIRHDIDEDKIMELPYTTIDGKLVTEESFKLKI